MRFLISVIVTLIILSGCAQKEVYIDRPVTVYVPTACSAPVPERPVAQSNAAMNIDVIDKYIKDLEGFVKACTKAK